MFGEDVRAAHRMRLSIGAYVIKLPFGLEGWSEQTTSPDGRRMTIGNEDALPIHRKGNAYASAYARRSVGDALALEAGGLIHISSRKCPRSRINKKDG